jgi:hypothetical protein
MKLNRISPWVVAGIGAALSLLAIAGIFFLMIKPTLDQTAAQQAIYDQNYQDSTPQAQRLAQNQLAAAKLQVKQIQFQWAVKSAARMPRYDVSNRTLALKQITYELTRYLGPDIQHQLRATPGAKSDTQVVLPAPPVSPNDITAAPVVIPLGTITVSGDFRHILQQYYDWQYFNRLVLVDNLSLAGNSPYMTGTYTATLYIFPQNDTKLGPIIPEAGTGTGTGTTPGGFPGGSGSYPGGGPGGYPGGGSRGPVGPPGRSGG